MTQHEAVNQKVGEWYNSFEDGSAALVQFASQFVDQDWLMFIAIFLALILFGVSGLKNSQI